MTWERKSNQSGDEFNDLRAWGVTDKLADKLNDLRAWAVIGNDLRAQEVIWE